MADNFNEGGDGADNAIHVDLGRETKESEQRKPWQSGIYSKTLVKKKDLRVVLISMEPMARMDEHHADGTISVQILKGAIRIGVDGRIFDLRTGHLFTLDPSIKHDVQAIEESAFLVTISWPGSEKLRDMKHRGYGS